MVSGCCLCHSSGACDVVQRIKTLNCRVFQSTQWHEAIGVAHVVKFAVVQFFFSSFYFLSHLTGIHVVPAKI